jgi:CubicO group peptidase (beta-lactamase class C family)
MVRLLVNVIVCLALAGSLSSCLVGRFAWYNFSNITDYKIFPSRAIPAATEPFRFKQPVKQPNQSGVRFLDSVNNANNSVAFLIIRNDTLLYERYFQGYQDASVVASFSMAKSYTSALVGAALADGLIKSVDEPITNYLPELRSRRGFSEIKIRHLLQMTSGIKGSESYYNPVGQAAKLYYGQNLRRYMKKLTIADPPGTHFEYRSVNTQLLGLIVERVSGKSLTEYLDNRIWRHLQPEYEASWSIDRKNDGVEKAFCCINARARDFAKFGRLYLHDGDWNGTPVLPREWVRESTRSSREEGAVSYYKYQWWLTDKGFSAIGHLGQYCVCQPCEKSDYRSPWRKGRKSLLGAAV